MHMKLFEDPDERIGFIKKVYGLLSAELLFTVLFVMLPVFSEGTRNFMRTQWWLYIVMGCVLLITMLVLFCSRKIARTVPDNYIVLSIFTGSFAYCVAAITAFCDPYTVLAAMVVTAAVVLTLTVYAFTTKRDFTYGSGLLMMICLSLIMSVFLIFVWRQPASYSIYLVLIIMLYGLFLIHDTQLIMGGRRYRLEIDEYVFASVLLYTDIIYMFLKILELMSRR